MPEKCSVLIPHFMLPFLGLLPIQGGGDTVFVLSLHEEKATATTADGITVIRDINSHVLKTVLGMRTRGFSRTGTGYITLGEKERPSENSRNRSGHANCSWAAWLVPFRLSALRNPSSGRLKHWDV